MLAEYAAMIAVSAIAVTLWLGGWMRPFPNLLSAPVWEFIFSLFPGLTFTALALLLAFIALILFVIAIVGRNADTSLAAHTRQGIDFVYWFMLKVAIFMYL